MAEPRLARDRRSRRADCRLRVLHADTGGATRAFHLQADPRQDRASLRAAPPPAMRPSKGSARSMSRSCSCARGRGIRSSSLPLRWTGRLPQRPARRTLPRRSYENCGCSCWPNATIWVDEVEQRHGGRDRHHDFAEARQRRALARHARCEASSVDVQQEAQPLDLVGAVVRVAQPQVDAEAVLEGRARKWRQRDQLHFDRFAADAQRRAARERCAGQRKNERSPA